MRCTPSEHPVLCTEPAWNTPANRERMAEMMFEEFDVPAFYIANTGVLNTYVFSTYISLLPAQFSPEVLLLGRALHLLLTLGTLWRVLHPLWMVSFCAKVSFGWHTCEMSL